MDSRPHIVVAYATHRPETLPRMELAARSAQVILLEEPAVPEFQAMLENKLSIDDYLLTVDFEYPLFSRQSCELFRRLHAQGKTLLQVEPYLDELLAVQEFFADGGEPADVEEGTTRGEVYAMERRWTAALMDFYQVSADNLGEDGFDAVVESVKRFARVDAERGRMRDAMRAEAVVRLLDDSSRILVEAGYIHVALRPLLIEKLDGRATVEKLPLQAEEARALWGKLHAFGPGDYLTALYSFKPESQSPQADLWAAQSLIHNNALVKDEMSPNENDPTPHLRDEVRCNLLVEKLDYADCRRLHQLVSRMPTNRATAYVEMYIRKKEEAGSQ